MQIENLEAIPLVKKLEVPFEGGTYRIENRYTIVTRVTTKDGIVGETFGGDEDKHQGEIIHVINNFFKPALIGENVLNYERIWNKLFSIANRINLGNRSLHSLDMANHGTIMEALSVCRHCRSGTCLARFTENLSPHYSADFVAKSRS